MMKLRNLLLVIFLFSVTGNLYLVRGQNVSSSQTEKNLAAVATTSGSSRFGGQLTFLNDGLTPVNTGRMRAGGGNRPPQRPSTQWVQYEWTRPVSTGEI